MNIVLNATVDYVVSGKSYLSNVKAEISGCVNRGTYTLLRYACAAVIDVGKGMTRCQSFWCVCSLGFAT